MKCNKKQILAVIPVACACLCWGCGGRRPDTMGGNPVPATKAETLNTRAGGQSCPSQGPKIPGGIDRERVPLFVGLGFDDNGVAKGDGATAEGMDWALALLKARVNPDGSDVLASFYMTTSYAIGEKNTYGHDASRLNPTLVKRMWNRAYRLGHEIGNHTHTHPHGAGMSTSDWIAEMTQCNHILTAPFDENESTSEPNNAMGAGIDPADIRGFRTPFLEYTPYTLAAVHQMGFRYDHSIEEGMAPHENGTNFVWPYQLDCGSRAHDRRVEWGQKAPMQGIPGVWEMPVYVVIVPPDDHCNAYGVPVGLRQKMKAAADYFDVENGKITGFDYNMWVLFEMNPAEFLATLQYTFDLRLKGNRAPFLFGMHSDMYAQGYPEENKMKASVAERQRAIADFLDYALSHDPVRVTSVNRVLDWVQTPSPL